MTEAVFLLANYSVDYCQAHEECQKCSMRRGLKAPLVPLPVMEEPFQYIAMDIIGSLPWSRQGNKYITVVCNHVTCYPQAFAHWRRACGQSLGDDVCESGSAEGNKVFSLLWQQPACDLIDTSQFQEYSPIKVLRNSL